LSADVDLAIGNSRHRELDSRAGHVAEAGLVTVIEFISHIAGQIGMKDSGAAILPLPNDSIGGDGGREAWRCPREIKAGEGLRGRRRRQETVRELKCTEVVRRFMVINRAVEIRGG